MPAAGGFSGSESSVSVSSPPSVSSVKLSSPKAVRPSALIVMWSSPAPVVSVTSVTSKNFRSAVCTPPSVPVMVFALAPAISRSCSSSTVTVTGGETLRT